MGFFRAFWGRANREKNRKDRDAYVFGWYPDLLVLVFSDAEGRTNSCYWSSSSYHPTRQQPSRCILCRRWPLCVSGTSSKKLWEIRDAGTRLLPDDEPRSSCCNSREKRIACKGNRANTLLLFTIHQPLSQAQRPSVARPILFVCAWWASLLAGDAIYRAQSGEGEALP